MTKLYDTIIFDLDGTLLNTLEDLTDAVNVTLKHFGYETRTIGQVRLSVGNGVKLLMERVLPAGADTPDFDIILEYFKEYYSDHSNEKTMLYDGIMELVKALYEAGYKMAVVSNKYDLAVKDLIKTYFGQLITIAIGENEAAGIRKKPAPDTVYEAMDILGAGKENTLYIGDSEVDFEVSKAAGIDCMLVTWGFRDRKLLETLGAAYLIDVPDEAAVILNV